MDKIKVTIAIACFAAIASAAPVGGPSSTSVPKLTGPIPVTADSFPFLAANRVFQPLDLKKAGYVE